MPHSDPTTPTLTPAPQPAPTSETVPAAVAAPVAAPRPMSAVPVAEFPPLRPLPTADPYSPVAAGQALFCSVFNLAFATLTAWLSSIPQHLITQVRQTFTSHSSHSSHSSHPSHCSSVAQSPCPPVAKSSSSAPLSLSESILLACRALYSLLRVYHTFSSYWERVTPRQLGLLSRAAASIKAFSGRSFDFSFWADLARRPARSYTSSVSESPCPQVPPSSSIAPEPPSIPQFEIRNLQSAIRNPFPEWPFTALTAYNASFTTAPGRLLAQVCHDLARLTQSPSASEFESPSPSCSQSIPSIGSMGSIGPIPPVSKSPSPQVSLSSPVALSPDPQVALSSSLSSALQTPPFPPSPP